eukprot:m.257725 g.257725  ORF g.257725 m.257725 type:complete len:851 (+) comp35642_c0_seq1:139-2691(+)
MFVPCQQTTRFTLWMFVLSTIISTVDAKKQNYGHYIDCSDTCYPPELDDIEKPVRADLLPAHRYYHFVGVNRKTALKNSRMLNEDPDYTEPLPNLLAQLGLTGGGRLDYDFEFNTRQFVKGPLTLNDTEFCWETDGDNGVPGPCMEMSPGDTVYIKVENNISADFGTNATYYFADDSMTDVPEKFLWQNNNDSTLVYPYGVASQQNLPGSWTEFNPDDDNKTFGFNTMNLHLHGLETQPHLFDPQGTSDPKAEWISLTPKVEGRPNGSCYCYAFEISCTQDPGTFLYHTHRHGSTAQQGWNGMVGGISVVRNESNPNFNPLCKNKTLYPDLMNLSSEIELDEFFKETLNATRDIAIIYWNSHLSVAQNVTTGEYLNESTNNGSATVDIPYWSGKQFLDNKNKTVNAGVINMVNDGYMLDDINVSKHECVRLRLICLNTENMCGYQVVNNATGVKIPLYVFAEDGLAVSVQNFRDGLNASSRTSAVESIILGPAQRTDVILYIDEPGHYHLRQGQDVTAQECILGGACHTNETGGANNNIAPHENFERIFANIIVENSSLLATNWSYAATNDWAWRVNNKDLSAAVVTLKREINFDVDLTQRNLLPDPQFRVSMKLYDESRTDHVIQPGEHWVEEWLLTSSSGYHPFHIHINPFQIIEFAVDGSNFEPFTNTYANTQQRLGAGVWRDTVLVPPMGHVLIRQEFSAGVADQTIASIFEGKTVFHCHHLTHEDQGMMANIILSNNVSDVLQFDGYVRPTPAPTTPAPAPDVATTGATESTSTVAATTTKGQSGDQPESLSAAGAVAVGILVPVFWIALFLGIYIYYTRSKTPPTPAPTQDPAPAPVVLQMSQI